MCHFRQYNVLINQSINQSIKSWSEWSNHDHIDQIMIRDRSINQVLISIKCRIRNKRPIAIFTNCQSFDQSINQTIDQLIDWSIMITNHQSTNTRIVSIEFMKEKTLIRFSYYYGTLNGVGVTYCYCSFLFFLLLLLLLLFLFFHTFLSILFLGIGLNNIDGTIP